MQSPSDPDADAEDSSFRMLCETCGVGFWHIDSHGRTRYLNPTMCTLLEVQSAAEIGDATYHQFFSQESLQRMQREHAKRSAGTPSTYEVELIGRRGTVRSVVISGAPVRDARGDVTGLIGTFTDISEGKLAEARLRHSERRLRSIFASSIDAIGVSLAGVHVMVNPAYAEMFGYASESELTDVPILQLIAPEERTRVFELVKRRSAGDNSLNKYLTRGLRKSGETFPMEVHVSTYEESGQPYTVVTLRDLTLQQRLEEQLRQSQKMDALGRLAGGVAHDFNNLLMVMMGCADLILGDAKASDQARTNAELINATGERAVGLTRQLLALSRRQVIDPKVIDVRAVVLDTSIMLRRLIGPNISLDVESPDELLRVRADPGQLQQVLMNLCVNARDAMPLGGRIRIIIRNIELDETAARSRVDLRAGHYVRLEVRDTGHGMDEATRLRLFEPFFTTKALGEGTGLGLSTVYGIVKQSGGHVTVQSKVGEGSAFVVYLPTVDLPLSADQARPVSAPNDTGGTVLLVEDEPTVRELVHRFLETLGFKVLATPNALDALALFKNEHASIDVVVSDMLMPGMSGVELARELDAIVPNVPILFVSGYARDDGASVLASRPGSRFLPKPFSVHELGAQLRNLLSARTRA